MSLRWKIALAMAVVAALTVAVFGTLSYRSTRDRLFAEIDRSLGSIDIGRETFPDRGPLAGFDAQVVTANGLVRESTFTPELPVTGGDLELIGRRDSVFSTRSAGDTAYRVRSVGFPQFVVQIGRSLDETDRVLASLRARAIVIGALVSALATGLGLWIAGRVTASLRRLTAAAEHVETTGRLDVTVGENGADEVGRLGVAFDRMLAALARSKDDQRRLVQDAGHELRTPLTSLTTNVDTLRRFPNMTASDRAAILADLDAETRELADLVNEVVAVATSGASDEAMTSFDLADIATESSDRFERRTGRPFVVDAQPSPIVGQRSGIQRAVSCLLENASKFDTTGGPIDVSVRDGAVIVMDRGIGIPEADLATVFDRFHRSPEARTMPGSGLGLSIVQEVARRHGGEAFASNRAGGGAVVGFRLRTLPPPTP